MPELTVLLSADQADLLMGIQTANRRAKARADSLRSDGQVLEDEADLLEDEAEASSRAGLRVILAAHGFSNVTEKVRAEQTDSGVELSWTAADTPAAG